MRLSSIQIYNQALGGIRNATSEISNTQEQIATNKRINTPSDDPAASALILNLETELERSRQFQRNIDRIESYLQRGETQISSIENVVDKVRELVIQANGVAMTSTTREIIAAEIEQRLQELLGLINSRDENGSYIFSGYNTTQPTFFEDDGKYIFHDVGYNFLPSEISAAFALEQLKKLPRNIKQRVSNFEKLRSFFSRFPELYELPEQLKGLITPWLAYPVIIKSKSKINRQKLQI